MKSYLILILLGLICFKANGQEPSWSVNAANYQYSMTFTTFLNVNGATLKSVDDKVAAFVNGEVRGVANVSYVSTLNKYVAYLSVFANTNNETISFKIYNSDSDEIVNVTKTETFVIDGNLGGVFQSYSLANPQLSDEVILNSFSFLDITIVSQEIKDNSVLITVPKNTDLTSLIAEFDISEGANFFVNNVKQISGVSSQNFSGDISYSLLSESEKEIVEYVVKVEVEISNIDPPEIVLTSDLNDFVNEAPVLISMSLNVEITDLKEEDVLLTNAFVSSIQKVNDFNYNIKIVPIQQGNFSIEITEGMLLNYENEGNYASNRLSFTFDLIRPYVLNIKRKNPINEISNSNSYEYLVTFNEAVKGVETLSFESIQNTNISVNSESDSIYTVTVSNVKNYVGVISLNIKSTNSITDFAGNPLVNSFINLNRN